MESTFGFGKSVDRDIDAAIDRVTAVLKGEGFGVLSNIDVSAKMKEKLGLDMPRYLVLGARNPELALSDALRPAWTSFYPEHGPEYSG